MKSKVIHILFFYTSILCGFATTTNPSFTKRMTGLCKVWGLVKYYHPPVARKKIDWDVAFINKYVTIKNSNDFENFNHELENLLNKAKIRRRVFSEKDSINEKRILNGELSKLENFSILNDTDSYVHQPDFKWINDNTIFSKKIQRLLVQIIIDFKPIKIKYLKGKYVLKQIENPYSNIDSVSEEYRMLGLFRYWNIVNYYYPYKYLTDKNWDLVLEENIPKFIKNGYFAQILYLTTQINDSHADGTYWDPRKGLKQMTKHVANNKEYYYPPFRLNIIDSNAIISQILSDSILINGDIQKGDILLKVNSMEVCKVMSLFKNRFPSSTEQSFRNSAKYSLIYYLIDTTFFNLVLLRGKDTFLLKGVKGLQYNSYWNYRDSIKPKFYSINDSIGYMNLDKCRPSDLRRAFRTFKKTTNIIFDMRGYPISYAPILIPRMLSRKPIEVANYYYPSKKYPGVFIKNKIPENYYAENTFSLLLKSAFSIKSKIFPTFNKIYNGNIIVLIDNEAVSYAETVCMILKAYSKKTIFIGTPTQGANGNVTNFFLPGGVNVCFSSIDWHYPNEIQLQRIGIKPDINVLENKETIKNGNDEIFERAIIYILTGE